MILLNKMLYGHSLIESMGIVYKGGGSSGTSTGTSSSKLEVDAAYQPDVAQAMGSLRSQYEDGSLGQVAGASDLQTEAFGAATGSTNTGLDAIRSAQTGYTDAMNGVGQFDATAIGDLEQAAIAQGQKSQGVQADAFANSGSIGGSRSAIAAGDQEAQLTANLAKIKYDQLNKQRESAMWGASGLEQSGMNEASTLTNNIQSLFSLGEAQRGITQEELDAEAKGLESYITGITSMQDLISTNTTTSSSTSQQQKSGK